MSSTGASVVAEQPILCGPTAAGKSVLAMRLAESLAPLEGFPKLGSCDEYWERSDHVNFSKNLHVPVAFLFSDIHEDYHRPTDTPDKIDYEKLARVVKGMERVIRDLVRQ